MCPISRLPRYIRRWWPMIIYLINWSLLKWINNANNNEWLNRFTRMENVFSLLFLFPLNSAKYFCVVWSNYKFVLNARLLRRPYSYTDNEWMGTLVHSLLFDRSVFVVNYLFIGVRNMQIFTVDAKIKQWILNIGVDPFFIICANLISIILMPIE